MPETRHANNKNGDRNQIIKTKKPVINMTSSNIVPAIIKKVLKIAPIIRDIELKTNVSKFFQKSKAPP
ncbi:hypothetical protein KKC65_00660 [Patescibacteria group bacterium]|nr:hypothetical protein [Patescibacteria group bacterium]